MPTTFLNTVLSYYENLNSNIISLRMKYCPTLSRNHITGLYKDYIYIIYVIKGEERIEIL